ncbi:hypothetical protein [uncultured Maricaulis sp.]|uniref:hypothetical protein n=1 Tax=uncultured Maricaulis sp. TaxID=174710 RepID=UPI0026237514|nr:hypothetical protein [uncultured Maricaulis sp.]
MRRTTSAIFFAALSGTLAGPPAFSQPPDSPYISASAASDSFGLDPGNTLDWRADLGLVLLAGDTPTDHPAWLGDIELGVEFESFTQGGRRWGWVLAGHAERDQHLSARGGRTGNCPAGRGDCASLNTLNPTLIPIAADSGLFSDGLETGSRVRAMISHAYLFADTGWGELRLGYGPGAARLDPVRGPATARLTRADGGHLVAASPGAIRTESHLSGQDPKLVFRSIALGQESSVGTLRASVSFTPEVRLCGVDACPRRTGPGGQVGSINKAVSELALTYEIRRGDHEWSASFATSQAGDMDGPAGFDPVSSVDAGLSWRWQDWRAGGRWRHSNNGLAGGGALEAWSVSAGWEQGDWLSTLEYATSSDDFVHQDTRVWQAATSRLIGDHGLVAIGVQSAATDNPVLTRAGRRQASAHHTTAFVELGWRY